MIINLKRWFGLTYMTNVRSQTQRSREWSGCCWAWGGGGEMVRERKVLVKRYNVSVIQDE